MRSVKIRLLGRFGVSVDGIDIPYDAFGGRRTRTLIALLSTRRGTLVPKDVLVEALWAERPPGNPFANLDVLASRARRALGDPGLIQAASGGVMLTDDARLEIDVERFAAAVLRGRNYLAADQAGSALAAFEEALASWADPLPDDAYSEWAEPFRRALMDLRLEAFEGGSRAALTLGNLPAATRLATGAVAADPLREVGNMLLVTALAQTGDQAGALEAFNAYRLTLRNELGLDPSTEAFELQSKILRGLKQTPIALLGDLISEVAPEDPRAALGGRGSGPMRARTLASMAMYAAGSDDYQRASEMVELALSDAGRDQQALAEVLYVGSIVDMNLGLLERAEKRADEALGHFEMLGDSAGVANILDGKAMATFLAGRVADGVAAFDRVARLFADSGEMARVITPRSTRGHGLIFMGRPEEALAETEAALALAQSLSERESEAYALWHRTEALAALGRADEAIESALWSLRIAEELAHREWTAAALRALGVAHRASGDLDRAEETHRRGIAASEGIVLFRTWHAAGMALTLLQSDRVDEARSWVDIATSGGPPLGLYEARLAEVRLLEAAGEPRAGAATERLRAEAESHGYFAIVTELESSVPR